MRQLLATLRHRPALLVGTFVALVMAALTVTWAFSLGQVGNVSQSPAQRLAGAAAVVEGNPNVRVSYGGGDSATTDVLPLTSYRRLPSELATMLGGIPGVKVAVADQTVPIALELPHGRLVAGTAAKPLTGAGWESAALTPFTLHAGHAPKGTRQLVVGAGLAKATGLSIGDRVRLGGENLSPFTVVGVAAAPARNTAGDWTVFFSGPEEAALYGHPGQADLIGIVAQPGSSPALLAERVRTAVAGRPLAVLTGSSRGEAENVTAAGDLSNLTSLGGSAVPLVLISLFVVASTVALSVAERARTMALLRAVGATPGQVRRLIMKELAVLGVIAGPVGYLPGTWLAAMSVRGLVAHRVAPTWAHAWTSPIELVPSVIAGVVVAELAGFFAARRASRARPSAALAEATIERRSPRPLRFALGLCALGAGVVLSVVALGQPDASQQITQAQFVLLAFIGGLALLGPYLMSLAELFLRLPLRLVGRATARLASAEVRGRSRRMAAAAVAIALPVALAGAISVIDATATHGSAIQGRQRLAASAVITAPRPGLQPAVVTAIKAEPGVSAAVGLVPTTVYVHDKSGENASGEAVTPGPLGSLLHLGVASGTLSDFRPGDIALSNLIAGKGGMNVHVGETVSTNLADGTPYRATVTAIFTRSLGFADVLIPQGAAGGGHLGATALNEVLVGTSPRAKLEEIVSLAGRYRGLKVAIRSVANAQYELLTSQTSYVNNLFLAFIGLLAAVALVNTLVMAALQSNEEVALLRRVGATGGQLLAMTAWQAGVVFLVGLVLGVGAQVSADMVVSKALTGSWLPYLTWRPAVLIVCLVVGLTGLAMVIPTLRMISQEAAQ